MAKLTDLWVHVGAKSTLKKDLGDAKQEIKSTGIEIGKLGALIAGAFSVSAVVGFTRECARLALGVDEIRAGFNRLNNKFLLDNLRQATSGTVNDINLMKAATRANSLGIPIQQLGTYFEFAERQAGELGLSVEQVVEGVVNGIGNKSTRAFRQFGVSALEVNKAFKDIEPEFLSVEEVSARAFLMINKKLEEMGPNVDSASDAIDRQAAAWDNVKIKFGEFINKFKAEWSPIITRVLEGKGVIAAPGEEGGDVPGLKEWNDKSKKEQKDQQERDASTIIWEGKVTRAIEEGEKKRAAAIKKTNEEREKALEDARKIIEGRGPLAYVAPGVPNENMPEQGATPALWADPQNRIDDIVDGNERIKRSFDAASFAAETFADSMQGAYGNIESVKDFANAIRNAAKQAIAATVAEAIATNVAKAVGKSKTWWGAIIAGAAAGGATAALFSSIVPSFAEGGVVHGKQLAMVGDNPSGTEAIIPKEQWGKMGQNIHIQGVVHGKDLYWVQKNYSDHLNRTT